MRAFGISATIVTLAVILCAPLGYSQDLTVVIQVSPNTLVIGSPGRRVTVHADIAFRWVDTSVPITITIAGQTIKAVAVFADDCGDLVAKFRRADVEAIVVAPSAALTFEGTTEDGETFSGTATIGVKEIGKK